MFGRLLLPKGIVRYALTPQIGERAHGLFMGGFGYVPFFIAVVYQMVGLLPRNHPYLAQKNIGRFGIRHVVAEAASNIRFSLKNIDQVVLFVAILAGLTLFFVQIIALLVVIIFQPVFALPPLPVNWAEFFTIANNNQREQDLANMMLDMVFGVPLPGGAPGLGGGTGGFFESCISMAAVCRDNYAVAIGDLSVAGSGLTPAEFQQMSPLSTNAFQAFPFALHLGLHQLFAVYSTGLLVIAVGITSYFIVTILAETAQSGTPFGRRFNKTWAPLRIVIAFGLLMPLTVGLNSSQYIVLYAAKYGSSFASNGWRYFNTALTTTYKSGLGAELVAVPNPPDTSSIAGFMFVTRVCKLVYEHYKLEDLNNANGTSLTTLPADDQVQMHVLNDTATVVEISAATPYSSFVAQTHSGGPPPSASVDNLIIRFGVEGGGDADSHYNGVNPVCGEIKFTFQDNRVAGTASPAPHELQSTYYLILRDLWHGHGSLWAGGTPVHNDGPPGSNRRHEYYAVEFGKVPESTPSPTHYDGKVDQLFVRFMNNAVEARVVSAIQTGVANQNSSTTWDVEDPSSATSVLYDRGWAGAGIWYNRIAQMNGETVAAAYAIPSISKYPVVMEKVYELKVKYDESVAANETFKPEALGIDDIGVLLNKSWGTQFAIALYSAYSDWNKVSVESSSTQPSENPMLSYISQILGVNGMYSLRNNPSTHPLAMLSGVGRTLVESSIRSTTYALALAGIGAFAQSFDVPKAYTSVPASFLVTTATLGLTVGFILFYVLPFLPFIYFFFAVGGWLKGIFEALVGAPLWALAHIRIDGNGMPGNAAMNGYFLIFEVFLRPILILFGLLASISIYSALVSVLNDVFTLVVQNVGGYDVLNEMRVVGGSAPSPSGAPLPATVTSNLGFMRSLIDEFFYTVIYTIIVYIIGMASFKLIDMIPNNILRWMGQSVATFGDQREDPAQGLVSKATIGSQQVVSKMGGGLSAAVQA